MRVFISYSHDSAAHRDAVRAFADLLRSKGYDAWIDQYVTDPDEGWARWMRDQIDAADVILIVPTETYLRRWNGRERRERGKGATWEGIILTNRLYNNHGVAHGLRAVLIGEAHERWIPSELGMHTHYRPTDDFTGLQRYLAGLPVTAAAPALGHAIAPMPVAWTTPEPPKWNPREALEQFLKDRFRNDDLARNISYLPNGAMLAKDLPDTWIAPNKYARALVDVLIEHGELGDTPFWDRMRAERNRFIATIDVLEAQWR